LPVEFAEGSHWLTRHPLVCQRVMARLTSSATETAIVDKPADEDEHVVHHHGHAR
jgi:hypothetical protein